MPTTQGFSEKKASEHTFSVGGEWEGAGGGGSCYVLRILVVPNYLFLAPRGIMVDGPRLYLGGFRDSGSRRGSDNVPQPQLLINSTNEDRTKSTIDWACGRDITLSQCHYAIITSRITMHELRTSRITMNCELL